MFHPSILVHSSAISMKQIRHMAAHFYPYSLVLGVVYDFALGQLWLYRLHLTLLINRVIALVMFDGCHFKGYENQRAPCALSSTLMTTDLRVELPVHASLIPDQMQSIGSLILH